jgi:hypothetical protein
MRFEISSDEVSKDENIILFIPFSILNILAISYFASSLLG